MAPPAPSYLVWVRTVLRDQGLDNLEWMERISVAMGARSMRLNAYCDTAGVWTVAFGPAGGALPGATLQIQLPKLEDAVRRAALLAVQ